MSIGAKSGNCRRLGFLHIRTTATISSTVVAPPTAPKAALNALPWYSSQAGTPRGAVMASGLATLPIVVVSKFL